LKKKNEEEEEDNKEEDDKKKKKFGSVWVVGCQTIGMMVVVEKCFLN
jgi:hypothetical protein